MFPLQHCRRAILSLLPTKTISSACLPCHNFCHSFSSLRTATAAVAFNPTSSITTSVNKNMSTASSTSTNFQAWRVFPLEDGKTFQGRETTLSTNDLPPLKGYEDQEHVLIQVSYSSLNYKDALSASGNKGVTRSYPHTPGIDSVGSTQDGTPVLVTGYDLGMNTNGGYGEMIYVPKSWIIPLPKKWIDKPRTAMIYGTAGLTAGLCIQKLLLQGHAKPTDGPVIVTGASGAVGSIAVELLTKLGFTVIAISGKPEQYSFLQSLGASQVLGRETLEATKKPLVKPEYAHGIDTVGGLPLVELLKKIQPGGSVACCGLVAGPNIETATVLPFILRGINLLGVDSVEIALEEKKNIWDKLANEWSCPKTEQSAQYIGRHQLESYLQAFLKGQSHGKIVLDHSLTSQSNL